MVVSVSKLLERYKPQILKNPFKIKFLGVGNMDVYNITAPFYWKDKRYIIGRVEERESIHAKACFFEEVNNETYKLCHNIPSFHLQDPFITKIDDIYIFGGVEIFPHPYEEGRVWWRTVFYKGKDIDDLEVFFHGPNGMKDIRLVELLDHRVGVFSRPQGKKGGRGKIGFTIIEEPGQLTKEVIEQAPLFDQFQEDEWGGANEITLLKDGKLGVLGHIANFTDNNIRHYYSMIFVVNPLTKECSDIQIIASRDDFLEGPSKREDLKDVLFSSGLLRLENGTAILYTGVSDVEAQCIEIEDPFIAFEKW